MDEFDEMLGLEKQLRDDKVSARVHFRLEVVQVVSVGEAIGMALRVAWQYTSEKNGQKRRKMEKKSGSHRTVARLGRIWGGGHLEK